MASYTIKINILYTFLIFKIFPFCYWNQNKLKFRRIILFFLWGKCYNINEILTYPEQMKLRRSQRVQLSRTVSFWKDLNFLEESKGSVDRANNKIQQLLLCRSVLTQLTIPTAEVVCKKNKAYWRTNTQTHSPKKNCLLPEFIDADLKLKNSKHLQWRIYVS
jgi:hypothetical protein